MAHLITVNPRGKSFEINENETILQAAIRANVALPYSCKEGVCGECKATRIDGSVQISANTVLTASDAQKELILTCCTTVNSDVTIEIKIIRENAFSVKKIPARVNALNKVASDVMIIQLQLPASEVFEYESGQYLDILLRDGARRSYSIANRYQKEKKLIELHIRYLAGGLFGEQVFNTLKEKDILRLEGPFGGFAINEASEAPIVFIVSGTGFAPAKAMIEKMQQLNSRRSIILYWGGRRPSDLYCNELLQNWEHTYTHFKYIPVVSDALAEDNWQGRTGFVHLAAAEDIPDMTHYEVYACGAPIVVQSAHEYYTKTCHLPKDAFFSDAFLTERDKYRNL